jgi:nitrate/nitrite transporter NarK
VLHSITGLTLGQTWPALMLVLLGILALVVGTTGGEFAETLSNGSSL